MTEAENPVPTFADLALSDAVARAVAEHGYTEPTPVQLAAFEPASEGRDLVVQARTGTGKTAAFSLPLVSARVKVEPAKVQALVLCPTRELALQVSREIEALSRYANLSIVSIYGGAPMSKQLEELQRGAHIVVGTPGRVLDHLERRTLDVSNLRCFILDECDEMLSMGFLPQITSIWDQLPQGHQTLLFSATVPKEVTRIADTRLHEPEYITLSGDHIGALEIQHYVYITHGNKLRELEQILEVENPESAIVFCNTRDETKRVAGHLESRGYEAAWLNADLSQAEREQVMARIREGKVRFLVCTDVAARGIDISHLTHVINYDFPDASEQYVHRTGRTGRAGKTGTAISLLDPGGIGDLYYLRLKYKIRPQERHLPTRQELLTRQQADVVASLSLRFGSVEPANEYYQLARRVVSSDDAESIIAGLLREHLRQQGDAFEEAASARRKRLPPPAKTESVEADSSERNPAGRDSDSRGRREARGRRKTSGPSKERTDDHDDAEQEARAGRRRRNRQPRNDDDEPEFRYEVSDAPAESAPPTGDDDATDSFVNLYVGVGRRDGAHPKDLQEALDSAGVSGTDTGRILVKQRHSFVEVKPGLQQLVIDKLNGTSICGREALVEVARPRS